MNLSDTPKSCQLCMYKETHEAALNLGVRIDLDLSKHKLYVMVCLAGWNLWLWHQPVEMEWCGTGHCHIAFHSWWVTTSCVLQGLDMFKSSVIGMGCGWEA